MRLTVKKVARPAKLNKRVTMEIVVIGDIHMATGGFIELQEIAQADLVIINGDITNFGGREEAKGVIDTLRRVNSNVLAQFGNLDRFSVNDWLEEEGINLHGHVKLVKECCLAGVGGSNPTPFNTPGELTERELEDIATRVLAKAEEMRSERPLIFISHPPAYGTLLDKIDPQTHVGSTAIRKAIERFQPTICVSGHIHEAKGEDLLGSTKLFNPGLFQHKGMVKISLTSGEFKATLQ